MAWEFLVRWTGYDDSENMWIPCQDANKLKMRETHGVICTNNKGRVVAWPTGMAYDYDFAARISRQTAGS